MLHQSQAVQKGGEGKRKPLRGRRGTVHTAPVYLTRSFRPLASNRHALPQCTSAEAMSWDGSLTIYPAQPYTLHAWHYSLQSLNTLAQQTFHLRWFSHRSLSSLLNGWALMGQRLWSVQHCVTGDQVSFLVRRALIKSQLLVKRAFHVTWLRAVLSGAVIFMTLAF